MRVVAPPVLRTQAAGGADSQGAVPAEEPFVVVSSAKFYSSFIMVRHQERSVKAQKDSPVFASALMRSGPHMAVCTANPSSIGLRPNGKYWRHRSPCLPAN